MKKYSLGFTLIELLVVISIISLLSSIVLVAVSNARTKAVETAIRANLENAHTQGEQYFLTHTTYEGVCTPANTDGVAAMLEAAARYTPDRSFTIDTIGDAYDSICNDTSAGWAAQIPLKDSPGGTLCVDSEGTIVGWAGTGLQSSTDVLCSN